jgi:DNA-binding IclR family transcriptional regulator
VYVKKKSYQMQTKVFRPAFYVTERTPTRLSRVQAQLEDAGQRGYFMEHGEFFKDVLQIGMPIKEVAGNVVASLGSMLARISSPDMNSGQVARELENVTTLIPRELGFKSDSLDRGTSAILGVEQ